MSSTVFPIIGPNFGCTVTLMEVMTINYSIALLESSGGVITASSQLWSHTEILLFFGSFSLRV